MTLIGESVYVKSEWNGNRMLPARCLVVQHAPEAAVAGVVDGRAEPADDLDLSLGRDTTAPEEEQPVVIEGGAQRVDVVGTRELEIDVGDLGAELRMQTADSARLHPSLMFETTAGYRRIVPRRTGAEWSGASGLGGAQAVGIGCVRRRVAAVGTRAVVVRATRDVEDPARQLRLDRMRGGADRAVGLDPGARARARAVRRLVVTRRGRRRGPRSWTPAWNPARSSPRRQPCAAPAGTGTAGAPR